MGIRETLNRTRGITIAVMIGIIMLAVGYIIFSASAVGTKAAATQERAWFTTDDGATWFADDSKKVPPFQTSDGKTAVSADVFKCGDGKPFVLYLQRFTPQAKKYLESRASKQVDRAKGSPATVDGDDVLIYTGFEVKVPKGPRWVAAKEPTAAGIMSPVCPDGGTDKIQRVRP